MGTFKQGWMVRAGRGGVFYDQFHDGNMAAIGWNTLGDLTQYKNLDALRSAYIDKFGNAKPSQSRLG